MKVLYFGTYSTGAGYPRNTVILEGLRAAGADVVECHESLFGDAHQKIAASTSLGGALRFGAGAARAWLRLAARFFRGPAPDAVVVGYTGHLDLFLARALSVFRRCPVVLDAFLSPYDTIVGDRRLVPAASLRARVLHRFERTSLRLADLVLTDTAAGARFLTSTFGIPQHRLLPVPVGSLVREPARRLVPVPSPNRGGDVLVEERFSALFVGSFVPLQGVETILDAAEQTPDIPFRILGDGPGGARIEEELRARNLANVDLRRRFHSRAEVAAATRRAGAVLGIFGTTEKAPRVIPCKVYDGLAAGMPVITADSPAARELLTHGRDALLVPAGNPAALGAALRRLRDEPALGERLRRGALALAETRFGPEAIGRHLLGALEGLCARRAGSEA